MVHVIAQNKGVGIKITADLPEVWPHMSQKLDIFESDEHDYISYNWVLLKSTLPVLKLFMSGDSVELNGLLYLY